MCGPKPSDRAYGGARCSHELGERVHRPYHGLELQRPGFRRGDETARADGLGLVDHGIRTPLELRAADPRPNELAHRYLQAIPEVAKGDANKVWVIPAELTAAVSRLTEGMRGPDPS